MDANTAQALLLGIMFDAQHLLIAKDRTLREVVRLLDQGANIDQARLSLRSPPDYGEVVAKLKSARRAKLYRVAGWVVVTSTVGSFQSNVARAFVSMGADVAVVVGETGGETRGSLRASQRFWETTKIHLGTDVAASIAEAGYGGGHPTAASFTCLLTEEKAAESALALLATLLKEKPAEIRLRLPFSRAQEGDGPRRPSSRFRRLDLGKPHQEIRDPRREEELEGVEDPREQQDEAQPVRRGQFDADQLEGACQIRHQPIERVLASKEDDQVIVRDGQDEDS